MREILETVTKGLLAVTGLLALLWLVSVIIALVPST